MVNARKFLGGGLRLFTSMLYFLSFCAAGIILGIFSYFLAKLHLHHQVCYRPALLLMNHND